jgi:hypothetical protein
MQAFERLVHGIQHVDHHGRVERVVGDAFQVLHGT